MDPGKAAKNNGNMAYLSIHIKHLLWMASAFTAAVLVSWALYAESKDYTNERCAAIHREMEIRYTDIKEHLETILSRIDDLSKISKK